MGPPRDCAALANCLLCDSYFMMVVKVIPPASDMRGREGTRQMENLLEQIQIELEAKRECMSLSCPTCTELVHDKTFLQIISSVAYDAVTTVCRLVVFEEGEYVPLYLNHADPTRKPKWQIAQGVGPPAFELDKTVSGRVYKPTLRQYGIKIPMWDAEEAGMPPSEYKGVVDAMEAYWSAAGSASKVAETVKDWWDMRPLFARWGEVAGELPSAAHNFEEYEEQLGKYSAAPEGEGGGGGEGGGDGGGGGGGGAGEAATLEEALEIFHDNAQRWNKRPRNL